MKIYGAEVAPIKRGGAYADDNHCAESA